jgi:adenylosuccinate lyase
MDTMKNSLDTKIKNNSLVAVGSIKINNKEVNIENTLKCFNQLINKEKEITTENLTIYRLDSLLKVIATKKIMLERIKSDQNGRECDDEMLTKLEQYTIEVNEIIKELLITNQLQNKCCSNSECEFDWR